MNLKKIVKVFLMLNGFLLVVALGFGVITTIFPTVGYTFQAPAPAGTPSTTTPTEPATAPVSGASDSSKGWGYLAAALATGLGSIGAGVAVSGVGSAAMGAISEKPELMGRSLIFVGLAEGIAIYGLIISIMILQRLATG